LNKHFTSQKSEITRLAEIDIEELKGHKFPGKHQIMAELIQGGAKTWSEIHKLNNSMKNGVFWDVTPCGSCENRCFGGT
jgi:hypothetical protein